MRRGVYGHEGVQRANAKKQYPNLISKQYVLFARQERAVTPENGLLYILGMPVFRQFAIGFNRAEPHQISFARVSNDISTSVCGACPSGKRQRQAISRDALLPPQNAMRSENVTRGRPVAVQIDPGRLRYPSWYKRRTDSAGHSVVRL